MTHHCHAIDCKASIPPRFLMCARHWRLVPPRVRRLVLDAYEPGQEKQKAPSTFYIACAWLAKACVALKEGKRRESEFCTQKAIEWQKRSLEERRS